MFRRCIGIIRHIHKGFATPPCETSKCKTGSVTGALLRFGNALLRVMLVLLIVARRHIIVTSVLHPTQEESAEQDGETGRKGSLALRCCRKKRKNPIMANQSLPAQRA
jgi:hypothetical protein